MDKYEYKVRSEEISKLIDKEKYAEAVKIADTIDWRRVKSASMLLKIAALYRISRRNEDSREMLMLAYERYPTNRSVVYSLCELSIELDDVVAAIEYYKRFAKLAPKDNGVYTLRYRILEAQEASLEERIEILEELKKKDYQEEWAYELAYLYHRIGLSTKCAEECDDIILWFGDGPYVMKAMELKAKHVPLTPMQQQNYEIMLGNAGQNYSTGNYDNENYDNENYGTVNYDAGNYTGEEYPGQDYNDGQNYPAGEYAGQNYDGQGYAGQNYAAGEYAGQNYSEQEYAGQNYAAGEYAGQNYPEQEYIGQNYAAGEYAEQNYAAGEYAGQNYDGQGYAGQNYDTQGYDGQNDTAESYGEQNYNGQNYDTQGYDEVGYTGQDYGESGYVQENYADGQYGEENYSQDYTDEGCQDGPYTADGYGQQDYSNDQYAQNNYVDDGYGNLSYVDDSYQDNSYTSEFYVEQSYDENGNLISPEMYNDSDYTQEHYGYPQGDAAGEDGYEGQAASSGKYRNGLRLVQNTPAPAGNPGDMSQYNTINLQKVVAESMKELFPDENDDVFAEDREKYNSGTTTGNSVGGDTRIFTGVAGYGAAKEKEDGPAGSQTQTGRVNIAQMVTGVSEKVPEPNTGAIKKVFVPGEDARPIKTDSDIEELRDTTEQSVDDEHSRMEYNDENVYHEQSIMSPNEADETVQSQATGSMNLDEVRDQWERMKQDNAKKNQAEIKKRVISQTGKIFANFDNSIKSGILGELEREEEEAERSSQTGSASRQGKEGRKSKDSFLDADITSDIPQQSVSEDDFDVEYVTDHKQPEERTAQMTVPGTEADSETDLLGEETCGAVAAVAVNAVTAESEEGSRTQKIYIESPEEENSVYTEESYEEENDIRIDQANAEKTGQSAGNAPYSEEEYIAEEESCEEDAGGYTGEIYEDADGEYTGESYEEDAGGYTGESYEEDVGGYTDEIYGQGAGEYTGEAYEGSAGEYTGEIYDGDKDEPYMEEGAYQEEDAMYADEPYADDINDDLEDAYNELPDESRGYEARRVNRNQDYAYNENALDPEDAESIAEMAKEDALKTQEIKMNTADLSSLSEKIVATTKKEASGARREEIRDFTPEEQTLFENFAVTRKIKKQIIHALENMTLAAYTGNVIITGDAGLDTVRMAKNLIKEYQASDESFSGRLAKITGEKINQRNIKDVFEKLNNGGIIIEKANGMSEEKLYELAMNLNQDTLGIVVIMEDTKKEITKLLEKQAMIVDYFNIRIDLMEMDNNALVAYAKNYALALEYSIDELGTLALYTRIANMQSGNHVVTKDEVRDIIDEAIWKSKKSKIKNFVDVLFARRYDNEDMIVLKERDFM